MNGWSCANPDVVTEPVVSLPTNGYSINIAKARRVLITYDEVGLITTGSVTTSGLRRKSQGKVRCIDAAIAAVLFI